MSRSACWMSSGVRMFAAWVTGDISRYPSGSSCGSAPNSWRAHSVPLRSPVSISIVRSVTDRHVIAALNRWSWAMIQLVR